MNKQEILELARQAECDETFGMDAFRFTVEQLATFAHLIEQSVIKRLSAGSGEPVASCEVRPLQPDESMPKRTVVWRAGLAAGNLYTESQVAAAVAAERKRCLDCYSPDDTVTDYQDKIRSIT